MVPGHHDIDFEICPGSIVFVPRFVHRVVRLVTGPRARLIPRLGSVHRSSEVPIII